MSPALLVLLGAAACPAAAPVAEQPGLAAVGKVPSVEAMRLNGEGKQLYRQERWSEARDKYRAALAADPDLLGAALNVACSFSRQGRYDEAADEAIALVRRAFVPWNREVAEAADLGILQDQPVYAKLQAARRDAAAAWGARLANAVFFVARTKAPLNVTGEGVLALGLNQEIFAWIPETGRFFQVTAEDGHVLAFALSVDGRRIAYLLGGKLVRAAAGQAGALRGLSLRVLELSTMALGPAVPLAGDVRRIELGFAAQPQLRVTDEAGQVVEWTLGEAGLVRSERAAKARLPGQVVLSGHGVEPASRRPRRDTCGFSLAMREEPKGSWRIQVVPARGKPFLLDTRHGAGLQGMPFSGAGSRAAAARNE